MTLTLVEPVTTGTDGDELVHVVCWCLPKAINGKTVALCGALVEEPADEDDAGLECVVCESMARFPGACASCGA